jgi:hypothetical protein
MWTANKNAVVMIMLHCREIPEVLFSKKLKKRGKTDDTKRTTTCSQVV